MKRRHTTALILAALAGAATPATAHADAFAESILVIDNFRLRHSSGTPFSLGQPASLAHGRSAQLARQFVGLPSAPLAASGAPAQLGPPPLPGTFSSVEQNMAAGARAPAGASRASPSARPGSSGEPASTTSYDFSLGAGDTMTVSIDAGIAANPLAGLMWNISISDLAHEAIMFDYAPVNSNGLDQSGHTGGFAGSPGQRRAPGLWRRVANLIGINRVWSS